jgi:cation diffusion facilitator CzcD-associated flavoprotein CzcO
MNWLYTTFIVYFKLNNNRSLSNSAAPIIGQGNSSLDDVWTPEPEAYLGLCAVKTPNMFFILGPNGAPAASMIQMAEFQMNYIVKAIKKIQREHIKSMVVS